MGFPFRACEFLTGIWLNLKTVAGLGFPARKRNPMDNKLCAILEFDTLEDRICPASYYWRPQMLEGGGFSDVMSDGRNWRDGEGQNATQYAQNQPPGENSQLFFGAFFNGTGRHRCVVDQNANTLFASITVRADYQAPIFLTQNITFNGQEGAQTGIPSTFRDANVNKELAEEQQKSMTFSGSSVTVVSAFAFTHIDFINAAGNEMTIGEGRTNWLSSNLINAGTITWVNGRGRASLEGSQITNNGQLNFTGNSQISDANVPFRLRMSRMVNGFSGTITKSGQGSVTELFLDMEFVNKGNLIVSSGTFQLGQHVGSVQVTGSTTLSGGMLEILRGPYYVLGGELSGVGTIRGNISTAPPPGRIDLQGTRFIHPGLGQSPGNLLIDGSLFLNPRTVLQISTGPGGSIGALVVNHKLFLDEVQVVIDRKNNFTPLLGASFTVLSSIASQGDLSPVLLRNNGWQANNAARALSTSLQRQPPVDAFNFGQTAIIAHVVEPAAALAENINPNNPLFLAAFQDDPDFTGQLTLTAVNNDPNKVSTAITLANGGNFEALSDGSGGYVPSQNYVGTESVDITVSDGTISKTATITFYNPDITPDVNDVEFSIAYNTDISIDADDLQNLLYNAENFDENAAITEVNSSANNVGVEITTEYGGTATIHADGSWSYLAPTGFAGDDHATIQISDGTNSATANLTWHVIDTWAIDADYSTVKNQTLAPMADPNGLLNFASATSGNALGIRTDNELSGHMAA